MFHPSEVELGETVGALFAAVDQVDPARVVIDSLSELRLLSQNPLRYRRQILALKQFFAERQIVVLGQAQHLLRQFAHGAPRPEQVPRGITNIQRMAQQMQAQIAELLDTAKLRAGQPLEVQREATDLVALTHTVVAAAQQGTERHQITVQTQLPVLVARVDPMRVERVLANLLSNAVKYSPAGGPITVTIDVEGGDAAAWAVVQVQDRDIGIPAADLPHVFEPFRRAANVPPRYGEPAWGWQACGRSLCNTGGRLRSSAR